MVTGVDSGRFIDLPVDFDQHCDCVGFCGLHVAMECPNEGTINMGRYEGDTVWYCQECDDAFDLQLQIERAEAEERRAARAARRAARAARRVAREAAAGAERTRRHGG